MNSAWFAMSARYSKTSSRGRAIVTSETSTGSTRRAVYAGGAAPRGRTVAPVLRAPRTSLASRSRRVAAQRAAQLADDPPRAVAVHALADQRRAAAVAQRVAPGVAGADALAQQLALQVGLGEVLGARHGPAFAGRTSAPCATRGFAGSEQWVSRCSDAERHPRSGYRKLRPGGPRPGHLVIDTVVMIVTS